MGRRIIWDRDLTMVDRTSQRVRRTLLVIGLGLILSGITTTAIACLPLERTVNYNGFMNGPILVGKIPARVDWTGRCHIWAEFNATGGTQYNCLIWTIEDASGYAIYGSGGPNESISRYPMPSGETLNIILAREWGGPTNVSVRVHWRVSGANPWLFVPGIAALIAGIPVAAMGRKRKERLMSLDEFEKNARL